jgi:hypothetical protein
MDRHRTRTRPALGVTARCVSLTAVLAAAAVLATGCRERGQQMADSLGDTLAANPLPACTAPATVTPSGVGPVRLGQTLAHVREMCTVTTVDTSFADGVREQVAVVHFGPHRILALANNADSTITRLVVADSAFATDKGVGVNGTVGMMRDAYGQLCAALGGEEIVVTAPAVAGISFATSASPGALPQGGRTIGDHPEAIPDSVHVTTFWIDDDAGTHCGGS